MQEVKSTNDIYDFNLSFLQINNKSSLLTFFHTVQSESSFLHLSIVTHQNNDPLLLICGYKQGFLVEMQEAKSFEFERFFANIKFFIEIDRDLAMLLYNLPLESRNIYDIKIAKNLCNQKYKAETPYITINSEALGLEINPIHLKKIILKNIESYNVWKQLFANLNKDTERLAIYESIIAEKYHKLTMYNTKNIDLARVSSIYGILSHEEKQTIGEVYSLLQQCAERIKTPLSTIITLQALETLILTTPKTFDEIIYIPGFNKKIVHSAVIRKILNITTKMNISIKRNRPLEMILDAILYSSATQHNIEKHFIASKYDIIALINGKIDVDFLKGWKKNIFGEKALDFLNNRCMVESVNMQFLVSTK